MVKLFTTPPVPYPYVLININRPVFSFLRYAEEVLIDSGIEIFRDPNVKDYPRDHERRLIKIYPKVREKVGNKPVYVTVPDYCDDYHPRGLWLSEEYTNIERTVDSVLKYTEKYDWIPWLIPVQGWYKNPESVLRSIKLYREYGIIREYGYFAVGNLCVEPDVRVICRTVSIVRRELPDKKIHVFGLKLAALRKVYRLIDSFDSLAWTRPVSKDLRANWSCKNKEERVRFFSEWLRRYYLIVSNEALDVYLR
jgi:hypothetical protein